jgi:hypothetical protein
VVDVTAHHTMLDADRKTVSAGDLDEGDRLALGEYLPDPSNWTSITEEMAEFLGLMVRRLGLPGRSARLLHQQRRASAPPGGGAVVEAVPGRIS